MTIIDCGCGRIQSDNFEKANCITSEDEVNLLVYYSDKEQPKRFSCEDLEKCEECIKKLEDMAKPLGGPLIG